jgi:hypothetical protein
MAGSVSAITCAICGAPQVSGAGACAVCGVAVAQETDMPKLAAFDFDFAPRKPATTTPKAPDATLRDGLRHGLRCGVAFSAVLGCAFAVLGLLVKVTIAHETDMAATNIILTGLGTGFLLGFSGGAIWGVIRGGQLGILGGAVTGALCGVLATIVHQMVEEALIFSTSEVPLASIALMGAMAGGVCGALLGLTNSD